MAPSIDWPTGVITVPLADLTDLGGGEYKLDTEAFRRALLDLEDSADGRAWPRTHRRNAPVLLGGVTYAQTLELINGYTVTFEPGAYSVRLSGSNNNIADVANYSGVSIRSANSAGQTLVTVGSGLTVDEQAKLDELWRLAGLDQANPVTATPTQITAGDVTVDIAGDPDTSQTATRQP